MKIKFGDWGKNLNDEIVEKNQKFECWKCKKNGCIKCIPNSKTVKGIDFDFCKNHSDYPNSKLKFDAEGLLEEEHNLDGGLNGN